MLSRRRSELERIEAVLRNRFIGGPPRRAAKLSSRQRVIVTQIIQHVFARLVRRAGQFKSAKKNTRQST
jgi:hypothetical protein